MVILYTNIHSETQFTFWDIRSLITWSTGDNFQPKYFSPEIHGPNDLICIFMILLVRESLLQSSITIGLSGDLR